MGPLATHLCQDQGPVSWKEGPEQDNRDWPRHIYSKTLGNQCSKENMSTREGPDPQEGAMAGSRTVLWVWAWVSSGVAARPYLLWEEGYKTLHIGKGLTITAVTGSSQDTAEVQSKSKLKTNISSERCNIINEWLQQTYANTYIHA